MKRVQIRSLLQPRIILFLFLGIFLVLVLLPTGIGIRFSLAIGAIPLIIYSSSSFELRDSVYVLLGICGIQISENPIGEISLTPTTVLISIGALVILIRTFRSEFKKRILIKTKSSTYLLFLSVFFMAICVSAGAILNSTFNDLTFSWLTSLLLMFTILRVGQIEQFESIKTLFAFSCGAVVTILIDLYLLLAKISLNQGETNAGRYLGAIGDYELAGEYFAVVLTLSVATLINSRGKFGFWVSTSFALSSLALLFSTETRSAILLGICGMLFVSLTNARNGQQRQKLKGKIVLFIGVTAALFGAVYLFISSGVSRLTESSNSGTLFDLINRGDVWVPLFSQSSFISPTLLGNGTKDAMAILGTYPHSLFFWIYWAFGIAGVLSMILILVASFSILFSAQKPDWLLKAFILCLIIVLLDQFKIEFTRHSAPTLLFFAFLGIAVSLAIKKIDASPKYQFLK